MSVAKNQIVICFFIIVFLALAAYSSSLDNGFVNWDDPSYVIDNYSIRSLSPQNLLRLFTRPQSSYYALLVFFSYAIEYHFFALNPYAYHLTNLLFHIFNSLLVFVIIFLLCKKITVALITAILFAIHPLHVESVAWITERKDVLCALFFLFSLLLYIKFTENLNSNNKPLIAKRRKKRMFYLFSLICFLMALLSKPMAVTLPLVLLLIDYYTLHNPNGAKVVSLPEINSELKLTATRNRFIRNSILNKIPFFVLSIVFGFIALSLQKSAGTIRSAFYLDPLPHILTALRNFVFYPIKLLLPFKLSAYYPYPPVINLFLTPFMLPAIIVITTLLIVSRCRKNNPGLLFGLGFYSITILPTLQLVPVGNVIFADRFSYLPSIGLFFLAAMAITFIGTKIIHYPRLRIARLRTFAVVLAIAIFSFITFQRCPVWRNGQTLWLDTIKKYPKIPTAHLNLGEAFLNEGDLEAAIAALLQSKELDPNQVNVYSNLGDAYQKKGLLKEAEAEFITALSLNSEDPIVHNNLGLVYAKQGISNSARNEFNEAISLKSDYAEPHNNLGLVYSREGNVEPAGEEFRKAISINCLFRDAYHNLANSLEAQGKFGEAIDNYRKAVELKLDFAPAYNDLGFVYAKTGRLTEAITEFEKAINLDKELASAYYGLTLCYFFQGENNRAIQYRDQAIELGYKDIPLDLMELK